MTSRLVTLAATTCVSTFTTAASLAAASAEQQAHEQDGQQVPLPPRPDSDEAGTGGTQGPGTWQRCAFHLALDNPFTEPTPPGMLQGEAMPLGVPKGLPFAIHHHNLTLSGIYRIQNARLAKLATDKVWTSCTMMLPSRTKGTAQARARPVAVGAPARD